ncbi:MAG: DUF3718 domain-containing protein [Kangiellaceae bacterium]|nr:DUF3718 domain-containing protein [Kangiellaceae bacterium]
MNKLIQKSKILGVALAVGFMSVSTQNAQAGDLQRLAENLCEYAKTDNRSSMRKKLKGASMKLKAIYPGLICGTGGTLMRVAVSNDAVNAAKFIASKAGKKSLKIVEKDGKSVLQFTENLVASGDSSKQVFVDLIKAKL